MCWNSGRVRKNEIASGRIVNEMTLLVGIITLLPLSFGGLGPHQAKPTYTFAKQTFVHRFTKGNLHEFTPKSQPNLQKWTDMITVNDYPDVKSGEDLAAKANGVLQTYKANKAVIVRTDSRPRTEKGPAEHLVVVLFPRPDFIEASFARFVMNGSAGASMVFSHRIYGKKAGDAMSKWLLQNGEKTEKELMTLSIPPRP